MSAVPVSVFSISQNGNELTPHGIITINDIRPRKPLGSLSFPISVNTILDLYVQTYGTDQYILAALPYNSTVTGRYDLLFVGRVYIDAILNTIMYVPVDGGSVNNNIVISQTDVRVTSPTNIRMEASNLNILTNKDINISSQTSGIYLTTNKEIILAGSAGQKTIVDQYGRMVKQQSPAPTIFSYGAGAGTGTNRTGSLIGTDEQGRLLLTTGAAPIGANADILTVLYLYPYYSMTYGVQIDAANIAAHNLAANQKPSVYVANAPINGFTLSSGSAALAANTQYTWTYKVLGGA